ncbi:substrate-binding domain-containing protein [Aerococcaceae bacterium NML130460]|nr:substrate-binding domain-containing protein [Aerococcaceae bacterium NML130460]
MKKAVLGISVVAVLALLFAYFTRPQGERAQQPIIVVSREVGSGTRGAFVDIMKVVDEHGDDAITVEADTLNGTSGVMQTVAGNPDAIGYISYGSLNDSVKAIAINGVSISPDAVKKGAYPVARPFNLVWSQSALTPIADDFLTYIFSQEGQALVEASGYIAVGARPEVGQTHLDVAHVPLKVYEPAQLSGQISIVGSTSLTPVVEKLAEAYTAHNPKVKISITSNGSTAGIAAVSDGTADLGMASRELKATEQTQVHSVAMALDGIVIIVNNASSIDDLTFDTVRAIYNGSINDWADVRNHQ